MIFIPAAHFKYLMANAVAKHYNVNLVEVLTGFKYIGQKMTEYEEKGSGSYAFGFEESYGCLIGTYARDKDAVVAAMALCEAACYYKDKGMTLWDAMCSLYEKYGYYLEDTVSLTMKGASGLEKIQSIMQGLRAKEIRQLGRYKVLNVRDYKTDSLIDYENNIKSNTGLPTSDVIYYQLENNSWVCVRPSGTEPKLKLYIGAVGKNEAEVNANMEHLKAEIKAVIE